MAKDPRAPGEHKLDGSLPFRIRSFAGLADYARMAQVYAACVPVDGLDEVMTIEDFAHFVENPVGFDPARDLLLAEAEGRVVGYGWASHRIEAVGDHAKRPEGDRAERPAGDRAERPDGDRAERPDGDRAERPDGDRAERPAGDRAERPGGDRAERPAGHRAERPEGDRAERPGGDRAERPGGDEIHMLRIYIHPSWRRRGLGSALLDRIQERSLRWESRPPGTRAGHLQTFVSDTEAGGLAFFPGQGFAPVRYAFKMERDLRTPIPSLPLPTGLELRPADESQDRAIWEAEREAFQDHWGYTPWNEEHFQRFARFPHYDRSLWRVAWEGDQVAGMVLNYINPEENRQYARLVGYTEDIAVRRPWRRRGLASALIARSLIALEERGMTKAVLSVDAENPTGALRVYKRLGYRPIQRWTIFRRRFDPALVADEPMTA